MEKLLTISQASQLLGVTPKTIRVWDAAGKIKTIRTPGNQRRIPDFEVARLMGMATTGMAVGEPVPSYASAPRFICPTRTAADLEKLLKDDGVIRKDGTQKYRSVKKVLDAYCEGRNNKVLGIYGLRRTGKSVLMRSKALELMRQGKYVVYFDFEVNKDMTHDDLMHDLKLCKQVGAEYVFVDEITFLMKEEVGQLSGLTFYVPEFPERGVEIYGNLTALGVHTIISGTDSFCLNIAYGDSLFDRMLLLHTTHIPYKEYIYLTGDASITEYLRVGGVLPRKGDEDWGYYMTTAILENITRSIEAIHPAGVGYRFISKLDDDEIKSLIVYAMQTTIIDFSDRRVFRRGYKYPDFYDGKDVLFKADPQIEFPAEFIKNIKVRLQRYLELTRIDDDLLEFVLAEMEDVLSKLEAITPINIDIVMQHSSSDITVRAETRYVLAVPGLRAYQLYNTLEAVEDEVSMDVRIEDKFALLQKIRESAEGHLIEALVLSETVKALDAKKYRVSQCTFPQQGEIDMVIENMDTGELDLFEIKRTENITAEQAKVFTGTLLASGYEKLYPDLRRGFSFVAGDEGEKPARKIKSYNVIYSGQTRLKQPYTHRLTGEIIEVNFLNIKEYLVQLC